MKYPTIFVLPLLLLFSLISLDAYAQDEVVPDTLQGWNVNWVAGLNGSQASYSNWSQGGVNNLSFTGNSTFNAFFRENRFSYIFTLNTRYGQTRVEDEGVRKTDDRLSVRNRFLYDIGAERDGDFKLFGNINFRTQFGRGFNYGAGEEGENILISDFMAPAYLLENAGIAYIPTENFSAEIGLGLQQTIVTVDELAELYGLDEGENFKNEAGLTFGIGYERTIATNLSISSSIETFTNLNKHIKSTDVIFTNQFTGRINDFMNASLRLDFMYNDDYSKELQVAQVLSAGISFILI
jgi:hypothetical protein